MSRQSWGITRLSLSHQHNPRLGPQMQSRADRTRLRLSRQSVVVVVRKKKLLGRRRFCFCANTNFEIAA